MNFKLLPSISVKKRIFSGLVILCFLAIISFSFAIKLSIDYLEDIILTSNYEDELAAIKKSQDDGKLRLPRSAHTFGFLASDGNVPKEFLKYDAGQYHEIPWNGQSYHLIISPIESKSFKQDMLYIAQQIEAIERYEKQLNFTLFIIVIGLMIASIWLAFWFTSFISKPITELSKSLINLQAGDAKLSCNIQDTDLAPIEISINSYLARINDYLLKEKIFSGIASHELRTPLSTIRSSLDTFIEENKKNPIELKQIQRIERIQRASIEMQYISESLLYLAKQDLEEPHEEASYAITSLLHEIIEEHQLLKRNKDIQINLIIEYETLSTIRRELVKIIIGNLLRNALENTFAGNITIELKKNILIIEDSGKGASQEIQDYLNHQPFQGLPHKQIGIGLFLVAKLCSQLGLILHASNSQAYDMGLRIELSL